MAMPNVSLTNSLASAVGAASPMDVPGSTVEEVLGHLCQRFDRLQSHLMYPNGRVKGHVMLALNGERTSLDDSVEPQDQLCILLATAGG
jgi:hypothetical protein